MYLFINIRHHNCSCSASSGSHLDGFYGYGGGILCNKGELNVFNSRFEECSGWRGGAIGYGAASSSNISHCIIIGSKSIDFGGGVYFNGASSATLRFSRVTFEMCSGSSGSALYIESAKSFEWEGICILDCGIAPIYSSSVAAPSTSELTDGCIAIATIEFNSAVVRKWKMIQYAVCCYALMLT